jgi:cyclopropane-fatty-acyl-phospholipid synthase
VTKLGSLPATLSPYAELAATVPSQIARTLVRARLQQIALGQITVVENGVSEVFGHEGGELQATIRVHDPGAWTAIALGGSLGAGESYMDGRWSADDLVSAVRVLLRASKHISDLDGSGLPVFRGVLEGIYRRMRGNTKDGSRRNVAEHYDLGNDFYRLWLDRQMNYSSAIWEHDQMTLEEAQEARLERVCLKLELSTDDHLIEIGTGWGAMALHAASRYGCRVTTATISRPQHDLAAKRIQDAGLSDRVTVLLRDYRDLAGSYDKLVSLEMIEAVGADYLETYFAQVGNLLAPNGLALIQSITIPDDRFAESVGRVGFIKRHIFPGGQLPSLDAMSTAWSKQTDLRLLHFEDFGTHYARTLHHWRQRFHARLSEVEALGYPMRFQRMWDFYLAACEGSFLERQCGVAQLLLARPQARRAPLVPPLATR